MGLVFKPLDGLSYFVTDIHGAKKNEYNVMNKFGYSLTVHLVPPAGQNII